MKHKKYTGFTLPELLAVLVIIAILSSLSLGYYKRSVEQSRFHEGLSVASALVEALNQAYLEDVLGGTPPEDAKKKMRKIKTLDFSVPNSKACAEASDYCIAVPHFELEIHQNDNSEKNILVRAYRKEGEKTEDYSIYIYTDFADSSQRNKIKCVTEDNQAFCESLGYVNCSGNACTK